MTVKETQGEWNCQHSTGCIHDFLLVVRSKNVHYFRLDVCLHDTAGCEPVVQPV